MKVYASVGALVRLLLVALVALSLAGAALAQLQPLRDVTGNYLGSFNDKSERGPGGRGVIGLTFSQGGVEGTFTGLATPRDNSEQLEFEGVYQMVGGTMSGQVEIRVVGSIQSRTAIVTGRCNKRVTRIKVRFVSPDGSRIKAKVRDFF